VKALKLDSSSPKPLYAQLKDAIMDYVDVNQLQPNAALPSERELCNMFGVSRLTVRKAIGILIQNGVVFQQPGKGTFVNQPKLQQQLLALTSFTEAIKQEGHTPGTQLLDWKVMEGKPSICHSLGLEPFSSIILVRRLRSVDHYPFSLATSYLPYDLASKISRNDFQDNSLYGLLEQKCSLLPAKTEVSLEVACADRYEATLMGIQAGDPLFLMKGRTLTASHQVMEYFEVYYRGDRLRFTTESQ